MSDLLRLLDLGAGALHAQNTGMSVATNNAANVNTIGYSRQRADLYANQASPLVGGVRSSNPDRLASELLSSRRRDNADQLGSSTALSEALRALESRMTSTGNDVTAPIAQLFARINELAAAPADIHARDSVLAAATDVASAFNRQAGVIEDAQTDADFQVAGVIDEANGLAQKLASLNTRVQLSDDPALRDQRDQAGLELAGLVGGSARVDSDGHMRFVLPGGEVMVDGDRAAQLVGDRKPGEHIQVRVVDGNYSRDVTSLLDGGRMGGLLELRDQIATTALTELDQLAFDLTTQVNAVHRGNAGLDGASGRDLFTEPAVASGAAAAFAVDPTVAGDASLVAAAAPGAGVSDNQGALQLGALRDALSAASGTRTFLDESIRFVASVGVRGARASSDVDLHGAHQQDLEGMRDTLSGVSIQEEMVRLSQFQHAAEAATRFISTVDGLLGMIIERL